MAVLAYMKEHQGLNGFSYHSMLETRGFALLKEEMVNQVREGWHLLVTPRLTAKHNHRLTFFNHKGT